MGELAYRRVLLKLSGEALAGERGFGIDFGVVESLTDEIKAVHAMGVSLGLVVGGGNIVRGAEASRQGMDRVSADYMGMLATVINALAMQDILDEIQSGEFAREWMLENQVNRPVFNALTRADEDHLIEKVGAEVRGLMPQFKK